MKRPVVAFVLSFILPGAGLAYVGHWFWGAVNLLTAVLLLVLGAVLFPGAFLENVHYPAIAIGAASAGIAHAAAERALLKPSNG